jgi:large subunit ribosomal protein L10
MNTQDKNDIVNDLSQKLAENRNYYITDISDLTANQNNALRRLCNERGVELQVVKNTLIKKALEQADMYSGELDDVLKGFSSIMFAEGMTTPAKLIKDFRKDSSRPVLKAAYIEQSFYVGDEQLDTLLALKSREQLIAEVVALLQSPIRNVISGLQGQGGKIAGILKTLSEKEA